MRVVKKLNNNVVLALTNKNEEVIIVGKGLGFQKTPYELEDTSVIEKKYVMPKNTKALEVLDSIDTKIIAVTEKIISYGTKVLNREINSAIFLGLCDHINYSVERSKEGIQFKSPLYWEIKHLYPEEYKIGIASVDIINEDLKMNMSNEEAAFIALHFINSEISSNDISETTKLTTIIGEILDIVRYNFKMDFDEESFNFTRLVTHIKYFILRQINNENLSNDNEFMFNIMKKQYKDEYECVKKIEQYLLKNYGWSCSSDEKLYLIMHIQRLRSRQENS